MRQLNLTITSGIKDLWVQGFDDNKRQVPMTAVLLDRWVIRMNNNDESSGAVNLRFRSPGWDEFDCRMTIPPDNTQKEGDVPVNMVQSGVDPFKVPTELLRAFRGSIFTARSNVPFGPRPNQDDNILAMDEILCYTEEKQLQMIRDYKKRLTYRHCTFTPGPPSNGYHGQYGLQPDLRLTIPQHKKLLQDWWNAGLYPVLFCLNADDGYPLTIEGTDALDRDFGPAYKELGKLIQIVVPGGWEPGGYNVSNDQWVYRFQWAKKVFPNARVFCLHMYSDFDAPIGGDDGVAPRNMTKQDAWTNLAKAGMTTFLDQVGGYTSSGNEVPSAQFISDFQDRIKYFINHFANWGIDVDYIAAEFAAFADYWSNFSEVYARQIGDAALSAGAHGYFDGGSL